MLCAGIDQHHSALEIIDQGFVGLFGQFVDQTCEQSLGLIGPTFGLQQNEGLAQLDVPRAVDVELANHHDAAKDQQYQKERKKPVLLQPH